MSEEIWDIIIFSETTAQGFVLQYVDRVSETTVLTQEDVNLYSLATIPLSANASLTTIGGGELGPFLSSADLEVNP